jgi:hypothetical protein
MNQSDGDGEEVRHAAAEAFERGQEGFFLI